jgi:bifunctional DNase/RNase
MMVEVVVARLGVDQSNQSFVVILREREGKRLLPIWIGQPEAESIVMQMQDIKRARPLTHDLCKSIIVGLGGVLRRVQITRVEKNTYFAEMHLFRADDIVRVDARPSDSIAIALRLGAAIYADESLLTDPDEEDEEDEDAPSFRSRGDAEEELSAEQLKRYLEALRPEDFGKFNP